MRLTSAILASNPELMERVKDLLFRKTFVDTIPRAPIVSIQTPCKKWMGAKKNGYGVLTIIDKQTGIVYSRGAHIISQILTNGPTYGQMTGHLCQETLCIEPTHLILVNAQVNAIQATINRQNPSPHNKSWKLTSADVLNIRELYYKYHMKPSEIVKLYSCITTQTVNNIVKYKSYPHVK